MGFAWVMVARRKSIHWHAPRDVHIRRTSLLYSYDSLSSHLGIYGTIPNCLVNLYCRYKIYRRYDPFVPAGHDQRIILITLTLTDIVLSVSEDKK
eukprot:SAG11_NODE_1147_length_5683_cov_40.952006_2_plen_95_part_00